MYEFEDYYQSEYDELIEETIDKIKKGILAEAKHDVEQRTREVEILKDKLKACQEIADRDTKEVLGLKEENKKLRQQLEKKINEIPGYKFNVGDKVWRVCADEVEGIDCPTCKGKHSIDVTIPVYGEVKVQCPDCESWTKIKICRDYVGNHSKCGKKYFNRVEYCKWVVESTEILGINIEIGKDGQTKIYYEVTSGVGVDEEDIFAIDNRDEAEEYANRVNNELRMTAEGLMYDKTFEKREESQGISGKT